jgi:hypothetical protein
LAVLLGCALRRSELAALECAHIQQRDGRWVFIDVGCSPRQRRRVKFRADAANVVESDEIILVLERI